MLNVTTCSDLQGQGFEDRINTLPKIETNLVRTDTNSQLRRGYETITAIKIHAVLLWVLTPCNEVVGQQRF